MMLLLENTAAIVALTICILAFFAGYMLRNWTDTARAEWADFCTYRRADHGRR